MSNAAQPAAPPEIARRSRKEIRHVETLCSAFALDPLPPGARRDPGMGTPTRRHFHLMVAPFKPNMQEGHFERSPVKTGFQLPSGMELPFWHVMFENLEIESSRGG